MKENGSQEHEFLQTYQQLSHPPYFPPSTHAPQPHIYPTSFHLLLLIQNLPFSFFPI